MRKIILSYLPVLAYILMILVLIDEIPNEIILKFVIYLTLAPVFSILLFRLIFKNKSHWFNNSIMILNLLVGIYVWVFGVGWTGASEFDSIHKYGDQLPEQEKIEFAVRNWIKENALYPESYQPVEFTNALQTKSYELPNNLPEFNSQKDLENLEKIKELIEKGDSAITKTGKISGYGINHSHRIRDKNGDLKEVVASFKLDLDLNIIRISMDEDFGTLNKPNIKEPGAKSYWEEQFGK